ncbi:hypothetical protein, partial [Spirosoma flavus]
QKDFFVRDGTGVISGALDQALEEAKDLPELVGLGLSVVSDPQGAKDQLVSFAQSMSWDKAQELAEGLAKEAIQYDNFARGGQYARYATGRVGVTLGLALATGGLVAMVKDAPNQLKKRLDDVVALLTKLKPRLRDISLADVLEKDLRNDALYQLLDGDNTLVESWEVLQKAERSTLKLSETALRKVKELLQDSRVQAALGPNYADELAKICKAQGFTPHGGYSPKSLIAHLDDVKTFFTKFEGKPDMAEVINAMKNGNESVQDGLQHTLTQMNGLDASQVKRFDMRFEEEGLPCSDCRFDVEMETGSKPRFFEYKSYQNASGIQLNQFKNYLAAINSLDELEYVFNVTKLTTQQAREGMKAFLKANADEIIKPISQGGIGDTKFRQLFGIDDADVFKARLDDPSYFNQYTSFVESR